MLALVFISDEWVTAAQNGMCLPSNELLQFCEYTCHQQKAIANDPDLESLRRRWNEQRSDPHIF
jgi:hypothetical protein